MSDNRKADVAEKAKSTYKLTLRKRDRHRKLLVVFGCLSTFLYVGAFFGSGDIRLLSLLGYFADRYGAPAIGYLLTAFLLTGLVLLVLAAHYLIDELLYVAFLFLALGSWTGSISIVQLGRLYFRDDGQSRVVFGLNALFDAAAITYLGLWAIAKLTRVSFTVISAAYLGLAVVILGGSSYLWSVVVPIDQDEMPCDQAVVEQTSAEVCIVVLEHAEDAVVEAGVRRLPFEPATVDVQHRRNWSAADEGYTIVAERTPLQQMTSRPAFMLALFFGIHVSANNWTLTTTRDFLRFLGDDELQNRYLTIFTLTTPASLAALPFVDAVLLRFGFHGDLQSVNVLALTYMTIQVSSDNLNVQVVGFVLFSFYRCFLFGVVFSYLPTLVSGDVIGKASGWMFLIAGLTAFLNIPLATLAVEELGGDFFIPNLVYITLYLPCVGFALDIGRIIKLETRAKLTTPRSTVDT